MRLRTLVTFILAVLLAQYITTVVITTEAKHAAAAERASHAR